MNEQNTRPHEGQDPTSTPTNPLTEIVTLLRGIGTRLDILEQRFEYLDRDVLKAIDAESSAVIDAEPEPPHVPTLALASDGRVLLSVHYVEGADISERQTWTGIILTEAEACDALDRMSDAADDTAGHVGGRIIANSKKREPSEGNGGQGVLDDLADIHPASAPGEAL